MMVSIECVESVCLCDVLIPTLRGRGRGRDQGPNTHRTNLYTQETRNTTRDDYIDEDAEHSMLVVMKIVMMLCCTLAVIPLSQPSGAGGRGRGRRRRTSTRISSNTGEEHKAIE